MLTLESIRILGLFEKKMSDPNSTLVLRIGPRRVSQHLFHLDVPHNRTSRLPRVRHHLNGLPLRSAYGHWKSSECKAELMQLTICPPRTIHNQPLGMTLTLSLGFTFHNSLCELNNVNPPMEAERRLGYFLSAESCTPAGSSTFKRCTRYTIEVHDAICSMGTPY